MVSGARRLGALVPYAYTTMTDDGAGGASGTPHLRDDAHGGAAAALAAMSPADFLTKFLPAAKLRASIAYASGAKARSASDNAKSIQKHRR